MCAICGILYTNPKRLVDRQSLTGMRDAMKHRGPDDSGIYEAPGIAIASRRLSIVDLSERGHMPMRTPDGRFTIVYNGEIFNFKELRQELISRGCQFKSDTDTEVVLNFYALEGVRMLSRLNGMFAIAIWDSKERILFLARDPLGIKPLYYRKDAESFSFASEAKAFFSIDSSIRFNPEVLEELLCFRFVSGEDTSFDSIKKLLPGHYLTWKDGNIKITRWWHLGELSSLSKQNMAQNYEDVFRPLFDDAVRVRTISDVPLGVFLSGGLDSNSIAASLAIQTKEAVKTFMVRFKDAAYDEGDLAHEMVKKFSFNHYEVFGEVPDLLSELKKSSWLNDEPLAHGNDLYFYILSRHAKKNATVLLTGEGADEIFGGYVRYLPLRYPNLLRAMKPWFSGLSFCLGQNLRLRKMADFLKLQSLDDIILYNACNVLPHQLNSLGMSSKGAPIFRTKMLQEAKRFFQEPVRQAMYLDQHTFLSSLLDRNDRMTMGASIECRPPFLDTRIVENAACMPTSVLFKKNRGKAILRSAMKERLPQAMLKYRKWGFGVPWGQFLRTDAKLKERLLSVLSMEPFLSGPLDKKKLKVIIERFLNGSEDYYALILEVLMISIWYEVFFTESKSRLISAAA